MSIPAAIILGILIGWLIEWVIDWFYWRRRYESLAAKNKDLSERLVKCSGEMESQQSMELIKSVGAHMERVESLPDNPDNLKNIKGIGPKIEKILNDAGITTFKQLAEQTPETLEGLLGDVIRNLSDESSIIQQARELVKGKDERS